jgi:hypothetical protein
MNVDNFQLACYSTQGDVVKQENILWVLQKIGNLMAHSVISSLYSKDCVQN